MDKKRMYVLFTPSVQDEKTVIASVNMILKLAHFK